MENARVEAGARLEPPRMARDPYRVLFLCTGNSAPSIMAECAMNRWGAGKLVAFSGGSPPRGQVHSLALELLTRLGYSTDRLRTKSWDEFSKAGSPPFDFVLTVCDQAAGESCPFWPGQPMTAHWGVEDPATFVGPLDAQRRLFARIYSELENRIKLFAGLPLEALDSLELKRRLDEIGSLRLDEGSASTGSPG
jgi:ArsR family transcriptional regulator, arsenate/arsenite/antimonite-responsive transcriptional repressor / arsenate reductase (thioredoxin)